MLKKLKQKKHKYLPLDEKLTMTTFLKFDNDDDDELYSCVDVFS